MEHTNPAAEGEAAVRQDDQDRAKKAEQKLMEHLREYVQSQWFEGFDLENDSVGTETFADAQIMTSDTGFIVYVGGNTDADCYHITIQKVR